MRMYRCTGAIQFSAAVEAGSLSEATRMIDDILEAADEIIISEGGGKSAGGDELSVGKGQISRSRIQVEQ